MIENAIKTKWAKGEAALGVIAPNRDPGLAEVIGYLGFDFYMLDAEHGSLSPADAESLVRACNVAGIVPLARVGSRDPKLILQFMDAGVMGIMMPGIRTAEDVKALVNAVKYPPLGSRGLGPVRAANYFLSGPSQADYVALANQQTLVLPQIETVEAVQNLQSLLAVPGVDGFVAGPRDLAMAMGYRDGPGHAEVARTLESIYSEVLGAGLQMGMVAGTGAKARELADKGVRLVLNSVNGLLKAGASAYFKSFTS